MPIESQRIGFGLWRQELAARSAKVAEFFYGDFNPDLVAIAHGGTALPCWQVARGLRPLLNGTPVQLHLAVEYRRSDYLRSLPTKRQQAEEPMT
jgi:hypothetical protein